MAELFIRTPDAAFENLPDYDFKPNYADVGGLRMHYVDERPVQSKQLAGGSEQATARTLFLFHGQPTWSYLCRKMIPAFVDKGFRVIAPDLIGFGKSDKPLSSDAHTYSNHVAWMSRFVRGLGVTQAAAFFQDWGGMIGLRVLAGQPEWLNQLVVANTVLADPKGLQGKATPLLIKALASMPFRSDIRDIEERLWFPHWLKYFQKHPQLEVGRVVQALTTQGLSAGERAAYDAPFPDERFRAGPRTLQTQVATDGQHAALAWQALEHWPHPVLTLFSDSDPFLGDTPYEQMFQTRLNGAAGQPHQVTTDASHFLQEDKPQELDRV